MQDPFAMLGSAANNKRDGDQPAVTDNGELATVAHFVSFSPEKASSGPLVGRKLHLRLAF